MNPALIVAIPVALLILGMILNSFPVGLDQPASPTEQDPLKRLEAERQSYRQVFDKQRSRAVARQKNVGRYTWLMIAATIGSFIWMYVDTVGKTTVRNQIATLQTLDTEGGKDRVLSLTTNEGSNVKYLLKPTPATTAGAEPQPTAATEKISNWETEKLGTAVSLSDKLLPLGISLKIGN